MIPKGPARLVEQHIGNIHDLVSPDSIYFQSPQLDSIKLTTSFSC